mgnify:CR=1 FL=1
MTVTVTQPSINVREKLTELDKPTGIAGEAMLRAETPQEQFNLINAGRRNLIINGGMGVAQRGTSLTVSTAINYIIDRQKVTVYDTGFTNPSGGTTSQIDIRGTTLGGVPFTNALRLTPNSAWALTYFAQHIEDVSTLSDTHFTVSVWMRVGSGTLSLTDDARLTQVFGSGGSTAVNTAVDRRLDVTTEWQRFSWTLYAPSVSGKTIGSGSYSQVNVLNSVDLSSFSSTLDITGFQVELGKVATPFEHRSYGEELALCQRYYERWTLDGGFVGTAGYNESTSNARGMFPFTVTKRTAPTMATSGAHFHATSTGTTGSSVDISWLFTTIHASRWSVTNSNSTLVDGGASILGVSGNGRWIEADAEL